MIACPAVNEVLNIFPGATVTAVERAQIKAWPTDHHLSICRQGELWVSKDLAAYYDQHDDMADDFTSVDRTGDGEKIRVYRRLNMAWYAWLYSNLRDTANTNDTTWKQMAARFNLIWPIVKRWWSPEEINRIHKNPCDYMDARYQTPIPNQGVVDRHNARRDNLRNI